MKRIVILVCFIVFAITSVSAFGAALRDVKTTKKMIVDCSWGVGAGNVGEQIFESQPTTLVESVNPIAVDRSGNVYVGDSVNSRVEKFDQNGRFLTEYKISDREMTLIEVVSAGPNGDVYALTNNELLIHFLSDGKVKQISDLRLHGILERNSDGKTTLGKRRGFSGYHHKLYIDASRHVFVLIGDLFLLNDNGELVKRWGPNIHNFLIDTDGNLTIFYAYKSKYEKLDRKFNVINEGQIYNDKGKFISSEWNLIRSPEFLDDAGCVYGFTNSKDNFLGKYCKKQSILYKLPIKQDDLIDEYWTVDKNGNVYSTSSHGAKFQVEEMIISD